MFGILDRETKTVILKLKPSRLPASPPNIDDLESQSSQPQPSSSNTISESQSPTGGRLPLTITESQQNNVLDAKPDLETELRKTVLTSCFTAAIQITIQYKQVAEPEAHYPHQFYFLSYSSYLCFSIRLTVYWKKDSECIQGAGESCVLPSGHNIFLRYSNSIPSWHQMCYMGSLHHVVDHYCLLHLPLGGSEMQNLTVSCAITSTILSCIKYK